MAVPTGLHLRGLPSLVYRCVWRCVFARARAATRYRASAFQLPYICTHLPMRVLHCVCVRVSIMTVILYDRMITPFSPQLRGLSPLPLPSHQRSYVLPHMSNPVSLWAATFLCNLFSLLMPAYIISGVSPMQNR